MFQKLLVISKANLVMGGLIIASISLLGLAAAKTLPEFNIDNKTTQNITKDIATSPSIAEITHPTPIKSPSEIAIDIQGAVNHPGMQKLPSNSRLSDAFEAAGHLSSSADTIWVARNLNLATKLHDGDKIYIPQKGEIKEVPTITIKVTSTPTPTQVVLGLSTQATSAPTTNTTETAIPTDNTLSTQSQTPTLSSKISINTATAKELDSLKGVGEKRAQDIIKGRPYHKLEELYERKIIYKSVYEKIKNDITL